MREVAKIFDFCRRERILPRSHAIRVTAPLTRGAFGAVSASSINLKNASRMTKVTAFGIELPAKL